MQPQIIIAYDVGTTGVKTCFFQVGEKLELLDSAVEGYKLTILSNGGAEQNPDDWFQAVCKTTKMIMTKNRIDPKRIVGISFCAQMQGVVLVDRQGLPVRPAMSYMDQRATEEHQRGMLHGIKLSGMNARKLLTALKHTGAVPASVKDPVWKYHWVKNNEPEVFKRVYKWLDIKEYLILKMTDQFVMTEDSAFATLLYDNRIGRKKFSHAVLKAFDVNAKHLPEVIKSTDCVGPLTNSAAAKMGLAEGIPVFGGGGDASLVGVGAGAVNIGDTHIYIGTSGWVSTVVDKRSLDLGSMIASIQGACDTTFNYFAELETAGKCVEWVRDHLAKDEIGMYLAKQEVHLSNENLHSSLYDYMMETIDKTKAGSGGVIFTPWLHGNRCPFEDNNARGMFFNIGLETGKTAMIRAVVEGVCYHLKWQLEASSEKVKTSEVIRFVGGGALSDVTSQILADVLELRVETVDSPQNIGSVGAAIVACVGLKKLKGIQSANAMVAVNKVFLPNSENREVHRNNYQVFKALYQQNRKSFNQLNEKNDR